MMFPFWEKKVHNRFDKGARASYKHCIWQSPTLSSQKAIDCIAALKAGVVSGWIFDHTSSRQHHPPILKHSHFYQPHAGQVLVWFNRWSCLFYAHVMLFFWADWSWDKKIGFKSIHLPFSANKRHKNCMAVDSCSKLFAKVSILNLQVWEDYNKSSVSYPNNSHSKTIKLHNVCRLVEHGFYRLDWMESRRQCKEFAAKQH